MDKTEINNFLSDVVGVVDTTSYERHALWRENKNNPNPKTWEENLSGRFERVGMLADMPVCISLWTTIINGKKILFVEATSQVVDYRLIEKWMHDNLPKSAFRSEKWINRVDANNFHNIFR